MGPQSFRTRLVPTWTSHALGLAGWLTHPGASRPQRNSLSRLWPVQIRDHSPLKLPQSPQQELAETPASLDLAEDRLHRFHPQSVALTTPFGAQLPAHPVPGGQLTGYATLGRRRNHSAVASLFRCDELVHAQGADLFNRLRRVVTGVGGYFLGYCAGVADGFLNHDHGLPFVRRLVGGPGRHDDLVGVVNHRTWQLYTCRKSRPPGAGMMRDSASGEVALGLVVRHPRVSLVPSASACSAATWAAASSAQPRSSPTGPARWSCNCAAGSPTDPSRKGDNSSSGNLLIPAAYPCREPVTCDRSSSSACMPSATPSGNSATSAGQPLRFFLFHPDVTWASAEVVPGSPALALTALVPSSAT